jgi:hypothetical protein
MAGVGCTPGDSKGRLSVDYFRTSKKLASFVAIHYKQGC